MHLNVHPFFSCVFSTFRCLVMDRTVNGLFLDREMTWYGFVNTYKCYAKPKVITKPLERQNEKNTSPNNVVFIFGTIIRTDIN